MTDETRKTADGEVYTYILAKAYTVRTEKNKDLITEIDAGIKKETSVGCSVKEIKCSICGKDIKTQGCEHRKGKVYGGKICCYLLNDPADAYEWSFVAVPAQKNAGIVKSFDPSRESDDLAEIAKEIRQELEDGIIRCAATVIPEMKGEAIEEICKSLSLKSLREMHNAFRENAQKSLPVIRQLEVGETRNDGENSVYKI